VGDNRVILAAGGGTSRDARFDPLVDRLGRPIEIQSGRGGELTVSMLVVTWLPGGERVVELS